jgi:hypothetical protein
MKKLSFTLPAAMFAIAFASGAFAVTCAEGVRHAGCVSSKGAVELRKPVEPVPARGVEVAPARAVEVPAARVVEPRPVERCAVVDGRRVCR